MGNIIIYTPLSDTGGSAITYDTDAQAYFDRLPDAMPEDWKRPYNGLFINLKNAGLYTKADLLYTLCGNTASNLLLHLFDSAYDLIAVNSPTFTAASGCVGDTMTADELASLHYIVKSFMERIKTL